MIRGRSPLDAARRIALGNLGLPKDFPGAIRIECVNDPGPLSRQDDLLAARQSPQDRRAEEPCGLSRLTGGLSGPAQFAVGEVECNHRIGQRLIAWVVRAAGRDVQQTAAGVDGGRRHDRHAGGAEPLSAGRAFLQGPRLRVHCVAFPLHIAGGDIERRDAAAEGAAWVHHVGGRAQFAGGDRDVQPVLVQRRRPLDARRRMRLDLSLPEQPAFLRIERIHRAACRRRRRPRSGAFCTSRCAGVRLRLDFFGRAATFGAASSPIVIAVRTPVCGVEGPIGAAGFGIERVHAARCARHEHSAVHDGRLPRHRAALHIQMPTSARV